MSASLVGSEMCIRDSSRTSPKRALGRFSLPYSRSARKTAQNGPLERSGDCLLYTSDAADDM
eukprot:7703185-Alexandrium_andersonii.AAC.1